MVNDKMTPENLYNILCVIYKKENIKKLPDQKGNLVYLLIMYNNDAIITIDVLRRSYKYRKNIKEIVNTKFGSLEILFGEVVPIIDKLMEEYLPS